MEKLRVLVFMANPVEQPNLAQGPELREITNALNEGEHQADIELLVKQGTRAEDVRHFLQKHRPHIVHFSGHGTASDGLLLEDDDGACQPVSAAVLGDIFRTAADPALQLVVFSVCHSSSLAEALVEEFDCGIGTEHGFEDKAARVFAGIFYRALSSGRSVGNAYEQANSGLCATGLGMWGLPVLFTRTPEHGPNVDAHSIAFFELASTALESTPGADEEPLRALDSRRSLRHFRWHIGIGVILLTAVIAGLFLLYWPGLSVPKFQQQTGILLTRMWLADDDVETAYEHLLDELANGRESYVRGIELSRFGWSEGELMDRAHTAGASLVVMVESGPRIRILPVPGGHGSVLLDELEPVNIARAETRAALAPALLALAWSVRNEPGHVPDFLAYGPDVPVLDSASVGSAMAVLSIYLAHLIEPSRDEWSPEWRTRANESLREVIALCDGDVSFSSRTCALAFYMYFGLLCPACDGADEWLQDVGQSDTGAIGRAAMFEMAIRRSETHLSWVMDRLMEWNGELARDDCARLSMAEVASHLLIAQERPENFLSHFIPSEERLKQFSHCGPMRAYLPAYRGHLFNRAGKLDRAVEAYERAAELTPGDSTYWLASVAVRLRRNELGSGLVGDIEDRLDDLPGAQRLYGVFLLWLATGDSSHVGQRLCDGYGDVLPGHRAMPRLGPLGEDLCRVEDTRCEVYRVLSSGRLESSVNRLCRGLKQ